jgi:predicted DCC family thiol-disulfide oxidoreductase YuxK
MNLIFFDSTCPLCQRSVGRIQERDKNKLFTFYPLTSAKAKELLDEKLLEGDTIVLREEDGTIWVRAKAIFRILELLGSKWGFMRHVPGIDLFYRIVAHNRGFIG